MDGTAIAKSIVSDIQYATLATVDAQGNPWNTPVYYAYDEAMNVYWSSHPESQHSRNIAENGKVFIVMYNSRANAGEGQGLYIAATADVLINQKEIQHGLDILGERRGKPFIHIEKFMGEGPQRIYRAVPMQYWINDADQDADGDFIKDFRIGITL